MTGDAYTVEGGLPRNFLKPCILLILTDDDCHGYEMLGRLAEFGLAETDPGGLYRTLRTMEREGLVTSHWETSNAGPARRTYRITEEGLEWLHAWAGALKESQRHVSRFLATYEQNVVTIPAEEHVRRL